MVRKQASGETNQRRSQPLRVTVWSTTKTHRCTESIFQEVTVVRESCSGLCSLTQLNLNAEVSKA